jgi:quinol monooxygenase YgiN
MIAVIASTRARAGHERELEELLRSLIETTRQEEGCIQYDLHVGATDPAAFAFYERWSSQAALDAHLRRPLVAAALPRIGELSAIAPTIVVYHLVD